MVEVCTRRMEMLGALLVCMIDTLHRAEKEGEASSAYQRHL